MSDEPQKVEIDFGCLVYFYAFCFMLVLGAIASALREIAKALA